MTLNIVYTGTPCDGLFYYSYEYCSLLNEQGIDAQVVIINDNRYSRTTYIDAIRKKYIHCENIVFDYFPGSNDISLILGRSLLTLSWIFLRLYSDAQQRCLRELFLRRLISVYSENHPIEYDKALNYYRPKHVIDLCDREVYPNGRGNHFEKTVNFKIHKPIVRSAQFKYLFLGTSNRYYSTVNKIIHDYPDHGILAYNEDYINPNNNNIFVPVDNVMGLFDTYVYTKENFDPAPRFIQECKYFNKNMIYLRDKSIRDGGSVYWKRPIVDPDISPIITAMENLL